MRLTVPVKPLRGVRVRVPLAEIRERRWRRAGGESEGGGGSAGDVEGERSGGGGEDGVAGVGSGEGMRAGSGGAEAVGGRAGGERKRGERRPPSTDSETVPVGTRRCWR